MQAVNYFEKQKFRLWWLIVIMIAVSLIPIGIFFNENHIINKSLFSMEQIVPLLATLIALLVILIIFTIFYLETEIDEFYISYKFFPFHFSKKKIYWEDIQRAYVRKYSPIGEFGGWGVRYSFRGGKAFNVSGNMGLQLELKNGKKILIGTQRSEELAELMKHLYANKKVNP